MSAQGILVCLNAGFHQSQMTCRISPEGKCVRVRTDFSYTLRSDRPILQLRLILSHHGGNTTTRVECRSYPS